MCVEQETEDRACTRLWHQNHLFGEGKLPIVLFLIILDNGKLFSIFIYITILCKPS